MEIGGLIRVTVNRVEEGFALVDYKGHEATLQQTEFTWDAGLVEPSDFVKKGDEITVKVIALKNERFSISLKQVIESPWNSSPKINNEYNSPVIMVAEYGYFVKIEQHCNALLQIENSKQKHSLHDRVNVKVIGVDISKEKVLVVEI
ncbi:S1 RNA-binding domain-containing protein [Leucothrix arctica]|uniref:S1 motif domain-containing protein n=1 Tax=Leucothrix arctica TaxID=1481894 RepID=A0A317CG41_9GAMM|nr:S1 RNA-binding domain-containing protein [Leucothrix arctica]PWQ95192.1 hypothetical protein DKT75_12645 [Leucothrix arctica]